MSNDDRFRIAAVSYLIYGIFYLAGAAILISAGIGVRGEASFVFHVAWFAFGIVLVLLFPWLISKGGRNRGCLWLTRALSALVFYRAYEVARIALSPRVETVPLAEGIEISMTFGAAAFFLLTAATGAVLAWASWRRV